MGDVAIPWSEAAQAVMIAIRENAEHTNGLPAPVLLGIVRDTAPGTSAIAQALRNPKIWPIRSQVANQYQGATGYRYGSGIEAIGTEAEAERVARAERAWQVGERHVLVALPKDWFKAVGIDHDLLSWAVHVAELGPATLGDIHGRWHGLVDSNIVLQFHDLDHIDWLKVTQTNAVTLWLGVSLLDELEHLKHESGSRRVRERAARFTKLVGRQLDTLITPQGQPIRSGVTLRVWAAPGVVGMRDDDHMQTARSLRMRGVPIHIVTADIGIQARARLAGFEILEPGAEWQLPKEPTAAERELAAKLAAAGLRMPPVMRMAFEPAGPITPGSMNHGTLFAAADELGGEALDVQCAWVPDGGVRVDCVEMTIGKSMLRQQDGQYHAAVQGSIAPGRSEAVALMYFEHPPTRVRYLVRATGASREGTLEMKDGQLVEAESST